LQAKLGLRQTKPLDVAWLASAATVGVTADASAPEVLVQAVIDRLERVS
jgi:4-hydroxy-3-methylbut-2-enyl diphosphate reductase IspH